MRRGGDLAINQLNDLFRRTGRRNEAGQRIGFLILDTLFGEGRHVR